MNDGPTQATPAADLEQQVMDPCVAKSEREWWAAREIERLRAHHTAATELAEKWIVLRRTGEVADRAAFDVACDNYLMATGRTRTILDAPKLPVVPTTEDRLREKLAALKAAVLTETRMPAVHRLIERVRAGEFDA